jgi:hypothetical protein
MDLYALGLERSAGHDVGRNVLHFLEDGKIIAEDWGEEAKKVIEARVREVAGKIQEGHFTPRTEYCPSCVEFKGICPYFEPGGPGTGSRKKGKRMRGRA